MIVKVMVREKHYANKGPRKDRSTTVHACVCQVWADSHQSLVDKNEQFAKTIM